VDGPQSRLIEDLSDVFRGDLSVDPLHRALYATDASLYQVMPLAVACPRDHDDVVTLARYAAEHRWPLFPRGAGRGVAGESLGEGIVVDFSRHMRRILEEDETTVRVEPGIIHEQLNRHLRQHGRYFAPDPSSSAVTTLGSMVALDAAGSHSISVGSTRDHVIGLSCVLADGECLEARCEPMTLRMPGPDASLPTRLANLLVRHAALIHERRPSGLLRNRAGYWLWDVWRDGRLDLPRLLVGSEGTLALFTSATLQTLSLPEHRGAALLVFSSLDCAVRAVSEIAEEEPTACDLFDRRLLNLTREAAPELEAVIPSEAEAGLLVEWSGWSDREVLHRLRRLETWSRSNGLGCQVRLSATSPDETQKLWSLTTRVVPLLDRLPGPTRPLPFVEDIAVPPVHLEEFVSRALRILQQHEITATLYAHAAAGQLHLRPFLTGTTPADAARLETLAEALYAAAWEHGGTVSGEHATGLSRSAFLEAQYGPLYRVFREIKHLFDPHRLLNPGKVITDDPHLQLKHLRPHVPPTAELNELQLRWSPIELGSTAARCNGCGQCRTMEPGVRMCPFFRLDPREAASPRAKANLVRHSLTGTLSADVLGSPELKRIADLCFNCKQCQLECPANVDIPHLAIEAKAQYLAQHGLTRSQWFISRAPNWTPWLTRLAPLVNLLQRSEISRWVLEQVWGVARRRKLPPWARRTFLQTAPAEWLRLPPTLNGKTVAYFVDHFANAHDPDIAHAFGRILVHHGYRVYVPPRQQRSGMELVSLGDLDAARALAVHNVRELIEVAQEGCPIVCTEPTAAVCLRFEYPLLLGTPEAALIASRVVEAGAFLAELHRQGQLRTDFQPLSMTAAYHTPCHLKALGPSEPLWELCRLIPELRAPRIDRGCSGMAGAFGLSARDFEVSLQIGRGLCESLQEPQIELGLSECSSCRLQMEQTVDKPSLHPIKLLAWSYGLMPELSRQLRKPRRPAVKST
jgi:FAD/FMN-containing dehydrogenase/Fe-S oxidoreductase